MTDHEKVFAYFVEEAKLHAGPTLRAVVVYGSSLSGEFRPGRSDYNFLLVVEACDAAMLERLARRMGKWRKKRISAPLVLSPEFLQAARDSYPLELLSILARHRVLYGEDPLAGLEFQREHVRLQCEREIRSKILLFRRAYLESEGAPKRLQLLLDRGAPSLLAILRGLLWLKEGAWQSAGGEFRQACERSLPLPPGLLDGIERPRAGRGAPGGAEVRAAIDRIVQGLESLAAEIDRW
jgi:predicted nucleotidyltransferase